MVTVKEWTTRYPADLDTTAQMPQLTNGKDKARVSHWHSMRDSILQLQQLIGSDNLESGSLRERAEFLEDGYYYLVDNMGGGGAGIPRANVPIVMNEGTGETADQAVGNFALNPNDYAVSGVTIEFRFIATAFITGIGFTGSVELYNLTDSSSAATLSFSEMSPTKGSSSALSLPAGERMYEVRIKCVGSPGVDDMVVCRWAGFEVTAIS